MILQCESCMTRYLVPATAVPTDGRQVRCGRCQHEWFFTPPADMEMPDLSQFEPPSPELKPIPTGSNLPVLPPVRVPLSLIAACLAGILGCTGLGLLLKAPGVYGYPSTKGLAIADVHYTKLPTQLRPRFSLDLKLYNTTEKARPTPVLRVALTDADGTVLQYWDNKADKPMLDPGESLAFHPDPFESHFTKAANVVIELGNPLELSLRR
jgi:predicted Zn finger-like uncharacterized protein